MNVTIDIPVDAPLFAGHFPGRPILPAVALLSRISAALDVGADMSLRGIHFLRLRHPVAPGDRLQLTAHAAHGSTRVDLRRDGLQIASGELAFGRFDQPSAGLLQRTAAPSCRGSCAEHGAPDAHLPPDASPLCDGASIEVLLPHRPPMRFVSGVLQETATRLACTARIPAECALVADGSAPALAAIEAAAQTAAVWEALQRRRNGARGGARMGYLVALRDIELYAARVPANQTMVAAAEITATALPLTHYAIEVSLDERRILRGTVATFLTDESID